MFCFSHLRSSLADVSCFAPSVDYIPSWVALESAAHRVGCDLDCFEYDFPESHNLIFRNPFTASRHIKGDRDRVAV